MNISNLVFGLSAINSNAKPKTSVKQTDNGKETKKYTITRSEPEDAISTIVETALSVIFFPFLISGCTSTSPSAHVKGAEGLTESEQGALDHLLLDIYSKSFKLNDKMGLPPTYRVETKVDFTTGRALPGIVKTVGVIPADYFLNVNDPKVKGIIKDNIDNISATWRENGKKMKLRITEWSIESTGRFTGGGLMPLPDMVVIYPLKVEISQK